MAELDDSDKSEAQVNELASPVGTSTLKIVGEIDMSSVESIRQSIDRVLEQRPDTLVLDMSEVQFMDSSGISMLLAVSERVGTVELHNAQPIIRRVIELTGLADVLRTTS
jgi:anti-sigma B factor antagonist